jgi:pilus assembly protein CpaC
MYLGAKMQRINSTGEFVRGQARLLGQFGVVSIFILLAAVLPITSADAQLASVKVDTEGAFAGEFRVPLNKSQILRVDQRFGDLRLGNSAIADVVPLTDRTIYVLGKAVGSTSMTILGANGRLLAVVDLMVTFDAQGLKAKLAEIVPSSRIEVRAVNNTMILSGDVASSVELARIIAVAETFAPNSVRNLLRLQGSQQVLLEVRIAEMSRTAAKHIGINLAGLFGDFSFLSIPGAGLPSIFAADLALRPGSNTIDATLNALEAKDLVKLLAKPNLIALSGETARFLAGGEFPYQIVSDGEVEIAFKEFGIGLAFTPTVLENGLINIVVEPEVSILDFSAAVRGTPGLSTRKAKTVVELRDGQTFAIAGLIQSNFRDNIEQVPFLGDIPILGALFRSSAYQREETELVIVITPRLVSPVVAGSVALPTDGFAPPSDLDLFLLGNLEGPRRTLAGADGTGHQVNFNRDEAVQKLLSSGQPAAGLDGPHGHILQ